MTLTKDEIFERIDWDKIMKMPRYAGGHDEQMMGLIKGAEVIAHWNEEDYQGQVATILKVDPATFIVYSDYYGSCSGCDAWEQASDEDVKKLCQDMVYSGNIFPSLKKVEMFLRDRENKFGEETSLGLLQELKKKNKVKGEKIKGGCKGVM